MDVYRAGLKYHSLVARVFQAIFEAVKLNSMRKTLMYMTPYLLMALAASR